MPKSCFKCPYICVYLEQSDTGSRLQWRHGTTYSSRLTLAVKLKPQQKEYGLYSGDLSGMHYVLSDGKRFKDKHGAAGSLPCLHTR